MGRVGHSSPPHSTVAAAGEGAKGALSLPQGRIPGWAYIVIPLLGFAIGLLFRLGDERHDPYLQMYATLGVAVVGLLIARAFTRWQLHQGQVTITAELDRLREQGFRVRPIRWGDGRRRRSAKRRARLLRRPPAGWVLYRPGAEAAYYLTPNSIPHNAGRRKASRLMNSAVQRAERETAVLEGDMQNRKPPWDKWGAMDALPPTLTPCLLLLRRRPRQDDVAGLEGQGVRLVSPDSVVSTLSGGSDRSAGADGRG